jgi:flagellar biosynthesis anti-sigma factor FlgM
MNIDPKINLNGGAQPEPIENFRANKAQSSGPPQGKGIPSGHSGDTVTLSGVLGTAQSLSTKLAEVPEIRTDRVLAIQQKVQSGQYQIDSRKIADGIIREHARQRSKS